LRKDRRWRAETNGSRQVGEGGGFGISTDSALDERKVVALTDEPRLRPTSDLSATVEIICRINKKKVFIVFSRMNLLLQKCAEKRLTVGDRNGICRQGI